MEGTLLVGAMVALIIIFAARKVYRDRKNGKGCGSCSGNDQCCHGSCESENMKQPH